MSLRQPAGPFYLMEKSVTTKIIAELNNMQNEALLNGVYKFAWEYIKLYDRSPLLEADELANVGLLAAIDKWEQSKGKYQVSQALFVTYARLYIRGKIAEFCELTVNGNPAEAEELDAPINSDDGDTATLLEQQDEKDHDPPDPLDQVARLMDHDYWWGVIQRLLRAAEKRLNKRSIWQVWKQAVYHGYSTRIVADNEKMSVATVYTRIKLAKSLIWDTDIPKKIKDRYAPPNEH